VIANVQIDSRAGEDGPASLVGVASGRLRVLVRGVMSPLLSG